MLTLEVLVVAAPARRTEARCRPSIRASTGSRWLVPMQRKPCGRDFALSARMGVTCLLLVGLYLAALVPQRSTIAITRGLAERLEPQEIEAVLAHEMSHIANRDGAVMTFASFPALTLREAIRSAPWKMWVFGFPLMVLACAFYAVGLGIMLTISRCREFTADRGAVLLTGAPEQLMSALQKIAGSISAIPATDLRAVSQMSAFFILPMNPRGLTHPSLAKRLARLEEMSRELGTAEQPGRAPTRTSNAVAGVWTF